MTLTQRSLLVLFASLLASLAQAESAKQRALLPPDRPWAGASRALIVQPDDPWITPSEKTGLLRTPSYDETMSWIAKLDAASPEIARLVLGQSPEGRDLVLVVVSKEGAATPAALAANGRPTLFAQAGIHSGEIEGKDAGLMLLRDLTAGRPLHRLLDRVNVLFVPIFNVDGHERSSAFGRINQRGPVESGWRTNARNLNLNRDYTKADTPEMRAMLRALVDWKPELYVDLHVTDGADYQYDVTWGSNGRHAYSPAIANWLEGPLGTALRRDLTAAGHIPGPFMNYIDDTDPSKGVIDYTAGPRFSHGYGALAHLPTVLVENHSLKNYPQRVLGMRVLLESMLRTLAADGAGLRAAVRSDAALRPTQVPLDWGPSTDAPPTVEIAGTASRVETSTVSGGPVIRWLGEPTTQKIPLIRLHRATVTAVRPKAYWIPPSAGEVIERLRLHGIVMETLAAPREVDVEMDRLTNAKLATQPFEGHVTVTAEATPERRRERMPRGSVRISTDQPLGDLAIVLLEPASPDSFFQWGFFLECLQRTEYGEGYILEPMAQAMLTEDPALKAEFEAKLASDKDFAANPAARLDFFYRRTPFYDERANLYPVARER
jgi:hypothetical protein